MSVCPKSFWVALSFPEQPSSLWAWIQSQVLILLSLFFLLPPSPFRAHISLLGEIYYPNVCVTHLCTVILQISINLWSFILPYIFAWPCFNFHFKWIFGSGFTETWLSCCFLTYMTDSFPAAPYDRELLNNICNELCDVINKKTLIKTLAEEI